MPVDSPIDADMEIDEDMDFDPEDLLGKFLHLIIRSQSLLTLVLFVAYPVSIYVLCTGKGVFTTMCQEKD